MKKVTRLFDQFKPTHYKISLSPDKINLTFSGRIEITGSKTGRPSKRLTFHQKGLKVSAADVIFHGKTDQKVDIDRINSQNSFNELRLHSNNLIYPGKYTVIIEFTGVITKNMDGIYPCFFKHDRKDKKLIATQFESHHAREVFPCIDEPEAKATFDLNLITDMSEIVISNTPIKKEEVITDKLKRTYFETTPIMSTYLLAFVYGDLKFLEAKTKKGVTVRTYATPDNVEFTSFALETAVKCLDYYSEYFDIDYPLDKCDMIALPDFASGAMENWGCITYREQTLLVDPKNTSLGMKQYVAMVVAHELTHQWFGNLVTMKWWTDLWLNEGFASWFEYLALDHLFPEWNMWTQFIVDDQLQALRSDALEHTHPVEVEVRHPDEIRTIFDAISYHKGAGVIHMLFAYLGAEDFQKGLRLYLKSHAYKNTITNDLWEALESASGKPVTKFMNTWTSTSGYPIMEVKKEAGQFVLSQSQFILNPLNKSTSKTIWPIPLLTDNSQFPEIFEVKQLVIKSDLDYVKFNSGSRGLYRTIYDEHLNSALAKKVQAGELLPLDRLSILSDITDAAKAGKISIVEALKLLTAFNNEDDSAVWDIIAGTLGSVRHVMNDEQVREDIKPLVRSIVAKQVKRLGWKIPAKEPHFDGLLRPTVLGMAASADDPETVKTILSMFESITDTNNPIDPDLRSVVYGTVARLGTKKDYQKLLAMHHASKSNEEKLNLCAALTGFKQPELIKQSLDLMTSEHVRLQDVSYWLAYSFMNRHAHKLTWEFLKDNWQWFEKNIGSDLAFYRMPMYAARGTSDIKFLAEYKHFFSKVLSPAFERTYNQGIEVIQWQSQWRQRDLEAVKGYLKNL